jgi:hypothetical protein
MFEEVDREPQVEDPCSVVKPTGTTVKMASKKVVENEYSTGDAQYNNVNI